MDIRNCDCHALVVLSALVVHPSWILRQSWRRAAIAHVHLPHPMNNGLVLLQAT